MRASHAGMLVLPLLCTTVAGCHSAHVETTVENRTGQEIRLMEVDYPSASFGKNMLASGEDYHYRFQISGTGPLKVAYASADGKPVEIKGPTLSEGQEGRLEIVLLPNGKARFQTGLAKP